MSFLTTLKDELEYFVDDFTSLEAAVIQEHPDDKQQEVLIYSHLGLNGDVKALVNTEQAALHDFHQQLIRESQLTRLAFFKLSKELLDNL